MRKVDNSPELFATNGSKSKPSKNGSLRNIGSSDDNLFSSDEMLENPAVIAILPMFRENQLTVGLGYADVTRRKLGLAEFLDDSQFTNVESVLVALGCRECLLPLESGKSAELKALHSAVARCDVVLTQRKKTDFKSRDLVQDLGRIVRGPIEPVRELLSDFEHALAALGALLSYIDLLADDRNYGKFSIQRYNIDGYMRLDSAAIKALNILENKTDSNKNFSLFGLINRTCTAGMGKRLLHRWLKQPLLDVNEINCRLDLVQSFVEDAELRQGLRLHLRRISDIERMAHSLTKKNTLVPVVKLYQSSIRLPYIKSVLEQFEGKFAPLIRQRYLDHIEYFMHEDQLSKFIALVEVSVDLDRLENGEYMISPSYDSRLSELKDELSAVEKQIHNLHVQTSTELDLPIDKALKLEKGTQFGHVFRITKKEEQKVRKKLSAHFIVLETRKDGIKFTNSKLKKLGDQYQHVFNEYASHQKDLVARVVDTTATFSEIFDAVVTMLSELDVLLCFADLALRCPIPYVRPNITPSDEGDIILEGSRHPCVEAQDGVNFIPNNCRLERGKSWFQIITGPNMGGKSTFIRQVGVNVLMAQIGCFVPCTSASISVRDSIYARVGAGDCQLRGVSTFMQEMLETASILKGASDKSLIIIDELGRGTSTYDGFGLAWAICEHLVEDTKAPTLFATHFHELTALANENGDSHNKAVGGVANYHVGAYIDPSSRKLTMLYKVEPGACDQSFGIHVAELAKFPECVVALAREKASELEDFSRTDPASDDANERVGVKRARGHDDAEDMSRGAVAAHRFLREVSALPLDEMDQEQAMQRIGKLRSDLERDAAGSSWLQQFL